MTYFTDMAAEGAGEGGGGDAEDEEGEDGECGRESHSKTSFQQCIYHFIVEIYALSRDNHVHGWDNHVYTIMT